MTVKVLSIDFDGCLHRGSDSVLVNFRRDAPPWEIELGLKAQGRFAWAEYLTPICKAGDFAVVIHSTWRKKYADTVLKHFLPIEVASRVIALDGLIEDRESLSSDDYLFAAIELIAPESVCVLDDRPEFFKFGKVENWIAHNQGSFVFCDPDVGVQAIDIRVGMTRWASESGSDHSDVSHPNPK